MLYIILVLHNAAITYITCLYYTLHSSVCILCDPSLVILGHYIRYILHFKLHIVYVTLYMKVQ